MDAMKAILTLLAMGMVSCMELYPIPTPESQPVSTGPSRPSSPPVSTSGCPSLDKKILGSWKCTTNRLFNPNGGSTGYSGQLTFNADLTLTDPDTLMGYKIGDELVTRKAYELTGDTLRIFVADRLERQVGFIMTIQTNQCERLKFVNIGSGSVVIELTR